MNIDTMIQSSASLLAKDYNKNIVAMPTETCKLPSRDAIIEILSKMKRVIFPGYFGGEVLSAETAEYGSDQYDHPQHGEGFSGHESAV